MVSDHGEVQLPCGTVSRRNEPSAPLLALSWVSVCFAERVSRSWAAVVILLNISLLQ